MPGEIVEAPRFSNEAPYSEVEIEPEFREITAPDEPEETEPVVPPTPNTEVQKTKKSIVSPLVRVQENWEQEAKCRGMDIDIFYSILNKDALLAKYFCGRCAVADACLISAFRTEGEDRQGVLGGLTHKERGVAIRRAKQQGAVQAAAFINKVRSDAQVELNKMIRNGELDPALLDAGESRHISQA